MTTTSELKSVILQEWLFENNTWLSVHALTDMNKILQSTHAAHDNPVGIGLAL